MDPKVIHADPLLASKPLVLRNGSTSTIATSVRAVETNRGHLEVPQLTEYHKRIDPGGVGTRGDNLSFTTSKSPRSWERSVRIRKKYLEKTKDINSRPDLDAVAEYYALRKVKKEQEERKELYDRLARHRDGMLRKMEERQVSDRFGMSVID